MEIVVLPNSLLIAKDVWMNVFCDYTSIHRLNICSGPHRQNYSILYRQPMNRLVILALKNTPKIKMYNKQRNNNIYFQVHLVECTRGYPLY